MQFIILRFSTLLDITYIFTILFVCKIVSLGNMLLDIDIDDNEWKNATETVEIVLNMLLCEIRRCMNKDIVIDKYVRQGM